MLFTTVYSCLQIQSTVNIHTYPYIIVWSQVFNIDLTRGHETNPTLLASSLVTYLALKLLHFGMVDMHIQAEHPKCPKCICVSTTISSCFGEITSERQAEIWVRHQYLMVVNRPLTTQKCSPKKHRSHQKPQKFSPC